MKEVALQYLKSKLGPDIRYRWVTNPSLQKVLSTNERTVKDVIRQLRCEGQPIASGDQGYTFCTSLRELNDLWGTSEEIEIKRKWAPLSGARSAFEKQGQMELAI